MAHHSSAREMMMQQSNANSYMNSSQSSSYSANVNRASSSSTNAQTFYGADESRNYARAGDEQQLRREDVNERELEMTPIPDNRALPTNGQPPTQGAPPSRPTYQTKGNVRIVGGKLFHVEDDAEGPIPIQYIADHPDPGPRGYVVAKSTYPPPGNKQPANGQPPGQGVPPSQPTYQTKPTPTRTKGNVRIVGGKLFHVEDDVEGPISIQYIPDHPDPGPRGYSVAKSTYPPPGKPRTALTQGGQVMHYIA